MTRKQKPPEAELYVQPGTDEDGTPVAVAYCDTFHEAVQTAEYINQAAAAYYRNRDGSTRYCRAPDCDCGVQGCGLPDDPERVQHARLIAAAPDLLAVLERVAESCAAMVERGEDCDPYDMAEAILADVRAAIAKAKGAA